MKKILCVVLTMLFILPSVCSAVSAVEADTESTAVNTLIVTANGMNPVEIEVGNEFVYYVCLYAGDIKIINGQVKLDYDSEFVSFVPHTAGINNDLESYCFPAAVNNAGVYMYTKNPNVINYNFSRIYGISAFNKPNQFFARFRFKATAPGTTDIAYTIQYMMNMDNISVYYDSVPNADILPHTDITIEPSAGCVGDADSDFEVSILDATLMQRISAGAALDYDISTADVTGDKFVSLRDAMLLRRYLAGIDVTEPIGSWIFASENG